MIFTFVLSVVYSLLNFIVGLLPIGHLPTEVLSALTYFWAIFNSFSYIFPVDTLLQAILLILAVEAVLWLFHATVWVLKHLPFMPKH